MGNSTQPTVLCLPHEGGLPEFRDAANKTIANPVRASTTKLQFRLPPEDLLEKDALPTYTHEADAPLTLKIVLDALKSCASQGKKYGIAHGFNAFRYREWLIYIETDNSVPPAARWAIMFLSLLLLQIGRALNSRMTFYFTTMSNENSDDITDEDAAEDQALKVVWLSETWTAAMDVINNSTLLKERGLAKWVNKLEQDIVAQGKKATRSDKHILLLNEVRERRCNFHRGWSRSNLDTKKLKELILKAWDASDEQPLCCNSLRLTYQRLTDLFEMRRMDKNSHPTTAVVLTASPIQSSEVAEIAKFQRKVLDTFNYKPIVKGEISEFVLTTYAFTGDMDEEPKRCYNTLDTQFEAKEHEDFLDCNFINEHTMRNNFLVGLMLMKMFNGHEKRVDNKVRFGNEKDKYGKDLVPPGEIFTIPSVAEVRAAIEQDDVGAATGFVGVHEPAVASGSTSRD